MKCPVCRDQELIGPGVRERLALRRCPSCGLRETVGFRAAAGDERFYGPDFYSKPSKRTLPARLYAPLERFFMRRRARELLSRLAPGARRVLDVGCGAGGFLDALSALAPGLEARGLEASAAGAAIARGRGVKAEQGSLEGLPREPRFDAITLWHVLEHVDDPAALLREAHARLEEGGVLLLAVPNIESLGFRLFGARWAFLDLPRHRWHFTPRALERLLRRAGFSARWDSRSLFEYETPLGALSLLNLASGPEPMLFYQAVKNEAELSASQRARFLALIALLPLAGAAALLLDPLGRLLGRPNNAMILARKSIPPRGEGS